MFRPRRPEVRVALAQRRLGKDTQAGRYQCRLQAFFITKEAQGMNLRLSFLQNMADFPPTSFAIETETS